MLSRDEVARIEAEARASAVETKIAREPFAAGPMIRELRDLIRVLPGRACLHACIGFCFTRIGEIDAARESLCEAESLLRGRGLFETADRLRTFIERLEPKA